MMASTSNTSNKVTGYLKKIIGRPVGELFYLTSGNVIIGRNREVAEVWVQDVSVSRSHCILKYSDNGWFIKDLTSINGTFLYGKKLDSGVLYPLKDGAGIYLGPPGEASVAFIFLTKMPIEQSCEIIDGVSHISVLVSNNNKCAKRQSDPEASTANECFTPRKKIATSPLLTTTSSSGALGEMEDNDNLSDCSFSSLRTRIKKSADKRNGRNLRKKDTNSVASTSSSPQLRSSSKADLESKPSTSTLPAEISNKKRSRVQKPIISKEFALLRTIFNESESSTEETIKGEDNSQSLLNDSKILIDCEPYPFSQPLPEEMDQKPEKENKNNAKLKNEGSVEELEQVTLQVEKLKKDKIFLSHIVQKLKSRRKKFRGELQKMLEEELMCTICTEVFVKAVTFGCSHTICEVCIADWKKRQKRCPICREKITSETKVLVLDSFIEKAYEQLDTETRNKRKELLVSREKAKAAVKKRTSKRGRGRRIQSDSSGADEVLQIEGERSNTTDSRQERALRSSSSILLLDEEFSDLPSDFSDLSYESDESIEGNAYFGGYGRCYNCGRRGHWANGCPF